MLPRAKNYHNYLQDIKLHCLKKNLNFFIKTEPVTAGAKTAHTSIPLHPLHP